MRRKNCAICLEVIILNKPLQSLDHIHADNDLKEKTMLHILQGTKRKSQSPKGKWAFAILLLCFFISFPILYLFNSSPSSEDDSNIEAIVSFDINPSMEFKVNKELIITSIKPYNQDAKKIIKKKYKRIDDAIDILLQDPLYRTYFKDGILEIGKNYVTVFYDIHEDNKVCGYQIISKKAESTLNGIYPQGNDRLQESFEAQTKDLVNTERTKNNLNILSYSEKATTSSRKHSEDMMIKNYFDHTNKENKSPFDRMEEEGINYKNAGENIAAGQSSAIYAHHAWMNSLGHRKNILGDYKYIGVGVIFGGYYNIYYTQNFYT